MDKKQDCAFVCLRCWTNNCLPSVFCLLAWGVSVVRRFLFHFHTVFLGALSESMLSTCFDFDSKFSNHCSIWTNIVQIERGIMETILFGQWRHASFEQTPIVHTWNVDIFGNKQSWEIFSVSSLKPCQRLQLWKLRESSITSQFKKKKIETVFFQSYETIVVPSFQILQGEKIDGGCAIPLWNQPLKITLLFTVERAVYYEIIPSRSWYKHLPLNLSHVFEWKTIWDVLMKRASWERCAPVLIRRFSLKLKRMVSEWVHCAHLWGPYEWEGIEFTCK